MELIKIDQRTLAIETDKVELTTVHRSLSLSLSVCFSPCLCLSVSHSLSFLSLSVSVSIYFDASVSLRVVLLYHSSLFPFFVSLCFFLCMSISAHLSHLSVYFQLCFVSILSLPLSFFLCFICLCLSRSLAALSLFGFIRVSFSVFVRVPASLYLFCRFCLSA